MGEQRKFKAFISYRHCPLDMAVAEYTQKLIERYRIPTAYRKDGQKRLGLVFRDVSELPLSSNLTQDIYTALDHSEFLIVVCTPETPKSLWVAREIEYFIKTHGRDRVLAILASGTPEESLPMGLTHILDEKGNVLTQIEPLCANLVAEDEKSVLKNLKREFLRLVAAMLDVPYDDLYQRRKRYQRRLMAAGIGSASAVVLLIMALLIGWNLDVMQKNEEIARNFRLAQEQESQALSLLSQQYLADGDRKAALESALQAVEGDRPYLTAAEGALAKALNPYGNGMLSYHLTLEQPTTILALDLSKDGSRLVTADFNDDIRCYDTQSGKLLWQYHCDNTLATYGNRQLRVVDGEKSLLVNSYNALYLLSMEDGSVLHSMSLLYDGRFTESSADVILSAGETQFTLCYETDGTRRYGLYDLHTFTQKQTLAVTRDMACYFEAFPGENGLAALEFTAVYADGENKLTLLLGNGEKVFLENFKPRPCAMDLKELYAHRLDDGSLVLVCYLEDSQYSLDPERRFFSIHKLDPQGQEVYRNQMPRDVYGRHQFVGDYLALFADDYNATLEFSTFDTVMTLQDMTDDFRKRVVDFGSAGVYDCYIRQDGQLVTVMTDGAILTPLKEEYGIVYTDLPDYGQPVRYAVTAAADTELVCMVPEDAANKVVMVRTNRNTAAVSLEDAGEEILFPSGKKFLTVSYDTQTYEKPPLVTVYDALTLAQLDQFNLEPAEGMTTIFGFSADENQIFFGGNDGYAYDMQTHQVTQLRRSEDALGMEYHQPQSSQAPGEPVISVIFGGLENPNEMYWYRNLEKAGSFVFPCETGEEIYPDWPNWYIGANGLIVCSAYSEENVELTETFVYSTRDGVCRRVPNPARELGYGNIGVANVEQLVAFANADGIIRIYDFHQDAVVRSYPLPVSPGEVSALQFVGQDQYLLVFKRNGSLTVLDAADGTVLQELLLDDPVSQYNEYVIEDSANQQLYLCTAYGSHSGYRIDMQTWEVLAEIPGMAAFLPESGQILQRDYYTGKLLASPVYSLEELIAQTRTVLDQT